MCYGFVLTSPTTLTAANSKLQIATITTISPVVGGPATQPMARTTIHTSETTPAARMTAVERSRA